MVVAYYVASMLQVLLSSHLGRPKDGPDPKFSLSPVAERLSKLLGKTVAMAPDCIGPQVSGNVYPLIDRPPPFFYSRFWNSVSSFVLIFVLKNSKRFK